MTRKRILPLFLLVVLSIPLLPQILPFAHAGNPSFINQVKLNGATGTPVSFPAISITQGNAIIVTVKINIGSSAVATVADTQANVFTVAFDQVSNGNIREKIFTSLSAKSTSSDTVTITIVNAYTSLEGDVLQYNGVTGIGASAINVIPPGSGTGTDTLTITAAITSQVFEIGDVLNSLTDTCGTISMTGVQRFDVCDLTGAIGLRTDENEHTSAGGSQSFVLTYSGWNAPAGFIHIIFELQGSGSGSSGGTSAVTSCFGNCGNPPITLVNTNSTHSFNFNQSLTVFYQFQSTLTGTLINVTTNLAKTYSNNQQVNLGVYIANCNIGVTPFTASCPGQLRASQTGNLNPVKGRLSFSPPSLTILNGQWIAISLSAVFSGLDINDTNTNVNLFQQNGQTPPILSQSVQSSCACKMGLWTWINGNTVVNQPPTLPPVSCGTDFICQLTQACVGLTPTNIVVGCFFLGIVWSIITISALLYVGYKFGGVVLPGGVFILIFWAWTTFFLSLAGGAGIAFIILEALIVMIIFSGAFGSLFSGGLRVGSGRESS